MLLQKGTLWNRIVTTADRARASGVLLPAHTTYTFIEDGGILFFVRILASLQRKDEMRRKKIAVASSENETNPFLSPEEDLLVADISDTHIAILNKFNVVDHHLLLVTRRFEEQEMLLTESDFEALWACMIEFNCLAFYNGGHEAGASQRHKHLQIVPLPLAPKGPSVPIEALFKQKNIDKFTLPAFSFLHAFQRLEPEIAGLPILAAEKIFECYSTLVKNVGMTAPLAGKQTRQTLPYCFLMTREWMLLVPRSREFMEDISINSLAYAGSFFVRSKGQLERLKSFGPLKALHSVAVPQKEQST